MWWPFLKHLRDFLLQQDFVINEDNPVAVKAGTKTRKPDECPCILLIRGAEKGINIHVSHGITYIWVETWVRSNDADASVAYEQLSALEDNLMTALKLWMRPLIADLHVGLVNEGVSVSSRKGDGDTFRPHCMSQWVIKIEWRK